MLRRLHLILAAVAMLIAPIAMQSGVAMAVMPMNHGEMATAGHCGDAAPDKNDDTGAKTQCCIAMCAALAPSDAAVAESIAYHAALLARPAATRHRSFLTELPTPPPRLA